MTVRYCDFCGKEIPLHSKVCPYCKKLLNVDDERRPIDEPTKKLDISKYINSEPKQEFPKTDYFEDTNIYSFSNDEIEKRFAPRNAKPETEEDCEEDYFNPNNQRDYIKRPQRKNSDNRRQTQKKNKKPLILGVVCGAVVLVIIIMMIINPFASKDTSLEDLNAQKQTTSTITVATTVTTTTEATTTTTEPTTIYQYSVDLDGYLGVKFENVKEDFGSQIKSSEADDYYGGQQYFFDGLTVSTSPKGGILSVKVDYSTASNKDTYRYQNITYYSTYSSVLADMGEPDLTQLDDPNEPCVGYNLAEGTTGFIKVLFDDNKKVNGFEIFYSEN